MAGDSTVYSDGYVPVPLCKIIVIVYVSLVTFGVIVTDEAGILNVASSSLPELVTGTVCPLASFTSQ